MSRQDERRDPPVCRCGKPGAVARYDARGIYLATVCRSCWPAIRTRYRPEVLTDPNYACDEPVDED